MERRHVRRGDRRDLFLFEVTSVYPTERDNIEFAVLLRASEPPPAPQLTREIDRDLAREAGYAGEFGAGGFATALAADPDLQKRHTALKRRWREEADAERARVRGPWPVLDRKLHDADQ